MKYAPLVMILGFLVMGGSASGPLGAETAPEAANVGQDTEKLLETLNAALNENRKMRQEMQELRSSSEKMIIERNDIAQQVQAVQQAVAQRERELNQRIAAAGGEVESARREVEALKKSSGEAAAGRQELEQKLEEMKKANEEMKKLLNDPASGASRKAAETASAQALAQQNAASVDRAVTMVSGIHSQNLELKRRLIASNFDLGNIYYDLGRYDEALAQYHNALRLDPHLAWAHHNLAIIYDYHFGDMGKAKYHYRQYMALKPAEEEASKVKMRLWDVEQLSRLEPDGPLRHDFSETQRR